MTNRLGWAKDPLFHLLLLGAAALASATGCWASAPDDYEPRLVHPGPPAKVLAPGQARFSMTSPVPAR